MARTGGYRRLAASKQKRRLHRFPGYYQYSNEIALIR